MRPPASVRRLAEYFPPVAVTSVKVARTNHVLIGDMAGGARFSERVRWALVLVLWGATACATTRNETQALREKCARNVDADERCVDLLTGSSETREAEAEVNQAEADKERDAFHARLQRLRDAEEARQNDRARTSTVASAEMWDEEETDAWTEILRAGREDETEDTDDGGSSVRALKAAPPRPVPPRPKLPVIRIEAPPPGTIVQTDNTPKGAVYLSGAKCLLRADLGLLRATLDEAKKQNSREDIAGSLALVILDAEGLLARVVAEQAKSGQNGGVMCSTGEVRDTVRLLRQLVGPRPKPRESGDAYGRGLGRLVMELEKRAGLARPE